MIKQTRAQVLQKIADTTEWDMIVIGGGITGAGIAREVSRLNLKVLLVEQKDFSWGTSSRSSKMVHGGLRYIASGDIKTTMHSVRERERMLNEAPGLVEEMAYVMPHYKGKFPPPWAFNFLLGAYDFFAGKRYRSYHKGKHFLKQSPLLKDKGLKGVSQFADAVTDDSRLVMRVLDEAVDDGACIINYMQAKTLLKDPQGKVVGVALEDTAKDGATDSALDAEETRVINAKAKVVVSATGAWADQLRSKAFSGNNFKNRIRPARGSHLVVSQEKLPIDYAYTMLHPVDKRALFVFPWETRTVIGTTDLDHPALDTSEVSITKEEVDYLLVAVNDLFPDVNITTHDVISSWAGVRPLISDNQDGKRVKPSAEKRDHSVWVDNGLVTVSGGKLTTFRLIALDVLEKCEDVLGKNLGQSRVKSKRSTVFTAYKPNNARFSELTAKQGERLLGFYGNDVDNVLALAQANELGVIGKTNTLWAELRFATRFEQVVHLDDLLLRRTRLGLLLENGGTSVRQGIKNICQQELGWDDATWQTEWQRYETIWQKYYSLPVSLSAASA